MIRCRIHHLLMFVDISTFARYLIRIWSIDAGSNVHAVHRGSNKKEKKLKKKWKKRNRMILHIRVTARRASQKKIASFVYSRWKCSRITWRWWQRRRLRWNYGVVVRKYISNTVKLSECWLWVLCVLRTTIPNLISLFIIFFHFFCVWFDWSRVQKRKKKKRTNKSKTCCFIDFSHYNLDDSAVRRPAG